MACRARGDKPCRHRPQSVPVGVPGILGVALPTGVRLLDAVGSGSVLFLARFAIRKRLRATTRRYLRVARAIALVERPAPHGEQRLLQQILRLVVIAAEKAKVAPHRLLVVIDQIDEGIFVPGFQPTTCGVHWTQSANRVRTGSTFRGLSESSACRRRADAEPRRRAMERHLRSRIVGQNGDSFPTGSPPLTQKYESRQRRRRRAARFAFVAPISRASGSGTSGRCR